MSAKHLHVAVATQNRGKIAELTALFADLPIELVPYATLFRDPPTIAEEGATFEENAKTKALAVASQTMMVTLADDSGLEIDALGGRPGVRSARFAKEGATDAENNAAVLAALDEVEDNERRGRFRCVLVLLDPYADDAAVVTEGRCEGHVARQTSGGGGFGYDPLFVVDGYSRTMAELGEEEKNLVSHRARAALAMKPALRELASRRLAAAAKVMAG